MTPTCLLFGVCFPDIAKHGLPFVTVVFAFMTFTGALKSRFRDVANVFGHPGALLTILVLLHAVIPSAACAAGHLFFGDNPELITGMVLEFAVPTAVVGLMWVTIYDGNSPLSLSLVILDTILAPFLIPLTLRILIGSSVTMDTSKMMRELVFMVAFPAVLAMALNEVTKGKVMKTWPGKLAPFSKMALIFVVTSNSSKVAPYVRNMNLQRVKVAGAILVLAASGYALGWLVAHLFRQQRRNRSFHDVRNRDAEYQCGSCDRSGLFSGRGAFSGYDRDAVPAGSGGFVWKAAGTEVRKHRKDSIKDQER